MDFLEKVVVADNGQQVRLMLWDTAGQEEFDAITRAYYRSASTPTLLVVYVNRNESHYSNFSILEVQIFACLHFLPRIENHLRKFPGGRRRWRESVAPSPWWWSWTRLIWWTPPWSTGNRTPPLSCMKYNCNNSLRATAEKKIYLYILWICAVFIYYWVSIGLWFLVSCCCHVVSGEI